MAPADASTVVLMTEGPSGPRVLLLKRHAKSRFMAGAFVFPGGRVDEADANVPMSEGDRDWCRRSLDPEGDAAIDEARAVAYHVAGIRELFEEAGVLLGRPKDGDASALGSEAWRTKLDDLRRRLNANETSFVAALEEAGLEIDVRSLRYWSHWITPSAERRRYDTRFFIGWLPEGQSAHFDDIETTAQVWMDLPEAIISHHLMRIFLAPPTLRTIEELKGFADRSAIEADSGNTPPAILPRVMLDEAGVRVLMPWDPGYDEAPGEGRAGSPLPRQARTPSRVFVWRPSPNDEGEDRAASLLQFWFGTGGDGMRPDETRSKNWWGGNPSFDDTCRPFEPDVVKAASGGYDSWAMDPQHDLARIILLDQMPRNLYRGTGKAFSNDPLALEWVRTGIKAGRAEQLPPLLRWFYYLPMMHAENLEAQETQVELYEVLAGQVSAEAKPLYEQIVDFARRHRDIVARFGRFPHRNAAIGRDSTAEEIAFLKEPGSSF